MEREEGKKRLCTTPKKPKFWIPSSGKSRRSQNSKTPELMALVDLFLLLNCSNNLVLSPEPQQSLSSSGLGHPGWELPLLPRENPLFLCSPHTESDGEKLRKERGDTNIKSKNENNRKREKRRKMTNQAENQCFP